MEIRIHGTCAREEGLECDCLSDNGIEIGCIQGEGVSLCHTIDYTTSNAIGAGFSHAGIV